LIDKANTTVVIVVSAAAFLFVFSAVATKTLVSQAGYQNRVIAEKRKARDQLTKNKEAVKELKKSYYKFIGKEPNVIGGNIIGVSPKDGDNTKIILDALPSSYNFPALASSLEVLVANQNLKINSIAGTDDEVSQEENKTSINPQPIPIPFDLSISANYDSVKNVVGAFEKSIRPIQLLTFDLSGDKDELTLAIGAQTYFQPAKSMNITSKVVQ
jgi:hypothetical protein